MYVGTYNRYPATYGAHTHAHIPAYLGMYLCTSVSTFLARQLPRIATLNLPALHRFSSRSLTWLIPGSPPYRRSEILLHHLASLHCRVSFSWLWSNCRRSIVGDCHMRRISTSAFAASALCMISRRQRTWALNPCASITACGGIDTHQYHRNLASTRSCQLRAASRDCSLQGRPIERVRSDSCGSATRRTSWIEVGEPRAIK